MSAPVNNPTGNNVFEQYHLIVEDTARLSDRRQTVSNIYLSANTLLASGIVLLALQGAPNNGPLPPLILIVLIVIGGTVLCVGWGQLIESYKELVGLRIEMLKDIERRPEFSDLTQTYILENALYDREQRQKINKKPIFGFSRIEARLPRLFVILYILVFFVAIAYQYPHLVTQFATWGITLPH